jgi:DNA-binding CsgD family transcriptional regulator
VLRAESADPTLRGRRKECQLLDDVVASARAGDSRVIVLRGEPGVGKTALLNYSAEHAPGCRVARAAGVESELELAFAALHQLCSPFVDRLNRIPAPQQEALKTAFGLGVAEPHDPFLVALAVLSLLAEAAESRPLICIVDDAQWLDRSSADALAFVARRLAGESVAMIFAARQSSDDRVLPGLPEIVLSGLNDSDAHALLDSTLTGPLDERVRNRIVAETRGNPLALLELPRGLTPAELAFGFGLTESGSLTSRIEQGFLERLSSLPPDTRTFLLTAAVEPVGDAILLWRALEVLEIPAGAAIPAATAGLVDVGARVRFRHPLVRSAVCRAASLPELKEVHRALAEVTDVAVDPDRRAWHRAHAATGPDEIVAGELERSAGRAQRRGGVAATAAFLKRAAELTPQPERRGERALLAAEALHQAAEPDLAFELLGAAELCPLDPLQQARLERLRSQLAFGRRQPQDGPASLLHAAQRLEKLDVALARETYLEALVATIFAGRLGDRAEQRSIALSALNAPPGVAPARAIDLLVDGLATLLSDGYAPGVPMLRRALGGLEDSDRHRWGDNDQRWQWLAWPIAYEAFEDEMAHQLTTRAVRFARDAGAVGILPIALIYRAAVHVQAGEFDDASVLLEEVDVLQEAARDSVLMHTSTASTGPLLLAAWRGDEAAVVALGRAINNDAAPRREGRAIAVIQHAKAVLYNGLGRYELAFEAAQAGSTHEDLAMFAWALVELIEAGVRSGHRDAAEAAMVQLQQRTRASGTDWAAGIEARSRALLSNSDATAEASYVEAIERLSTTRIRIAVPRAQLLYGEWLRRQGRRVDARVQLRAAYGALTEIGMDAFAERARQELLATGESARRRSAETRNDLTPQEIQIARLAGNGARNAEIGGLLFISARTVEWHLRKVFVKLGLTSRRQLNSALADL